MKFDKLQVVKNAERFCITFKSSTVKSLLGHPYCIPNQPLAQLLVDEIQGEIESGGLVRKWASRALQLENDHDHLKSVQDDMDRFYHTDTLLVRDSSLDYSEWDKGLKIFQDATGIQSKISTGFNQSKQPQNLYLLGNCEPWDVASLEMVAKNTKSFIIAYLFWKKLIDCDTAIRWALLESIIQSAKWGETDELNLEKCRLRMSLILSQFFQKDIGDLE